MHKPSGKKLLFLTGLLVLICAAFLMGGITMASASAMSTGKTPPTKPGPDDPTKGLATITRVTNNTIQVKLLESEAKGSMVTLLTTGKTTYDPDRSIVAVGKTIAFVGTLNHNGSITAQSITLYDPSVADVVGNIVKIDGSTVTLQQKDKQYIVHLTDSTSVLKVEFNPKKKLPATQSDLKVGLSINVHGTVNRDGSLTATSVAIIPSDSGNK